MFRTLASRLTAWYAGLFILLALILYAFFYWSLSSKLLERVDDELSEDAAEIASLIVGVGAGPDALSALLNEEIDASDADAEFIRVLSASGALLVSSDLEAWSGLDTVLPRELLLKRDDPVFLSVDIPGRDDSARVISLHAGDKAIVQLGVSREDDEDLLADLLGIFGIVTAFTILLGGLFGWFMSRRALRGVDRVAATALEIGRGDLSRRVALMDEGAEIEQLATAFNGMVEEIQRLISELKEVTQNIAHDLRSPVTRIRGVCETTLRSDAGTEEYRDMAATVLEEAERLVNMINIMLEIAETDAGVLTLAREPVDLNQLVREVVELYEPLAEDKDLSVSVETPDEDAVVHGDAPRLQRVFANLLDNAIKYTGAKGKIVLRAESSPERVVISVKDTGNGMDGETLARAFDRFYRGDRSRSTPGNGLGLSLASAFINAHGGEIKAVSLLDKGTEFIVDLPRAAGKSCGSPASPVPQ